MQEINWSNIFNLKYVTFSRADIIELTKDAYADVKEFIDTFKQLEIKIAIDDQTHTFSDLLLVDIGLTTYERTALFVFRYNPEGVGACSARTELRDFEDKSTRLTFNYLYGMSTLAQICSIVMQAVENI